MAKIRLGQRPEAFKKKVTFPLLDGTTGEITITYRYRTRKEFGALLDGLIEDAKAGEAGEMTMAELMARTAASNADYILMIATGWDIDAEFDRASIEQLADEAPAAVLAVMEEYRAAINGGRLGN